MADLFAISAQRDCGNAVTTVFATAGVQRLLQVVLLIVAGHSLLSSQAAANDDDDDCQAFVCVLCLHYFVLARRDLRNTDHDA